MSTGNLAIVPPSTQPVQLHERFRVLRQLGRGGMGTVYEVFDSQRERVVALKVLHDPTRGLLYRFKREFRSTAHLRHPNLVRLYDLGVLPSGEFYFTMERIEGENLQKFIAVSTPQEQTPLAFADTLYSSDSPRAVQEPAKLLQQKISILSDILQGIHFLHRAHRVHRDLKPTNIMVQLDGQAKLLDFGIIRELDRPSGATQTASAIGTPLYMSPEQASGGEIGTASDMYSFGCLLYEFLVGRPPFQGAVSSVIVQHMTSTPEAPDVPVELGWLSSLCLSLLEKDPTKRPTAWQCLEVLSQRGGIAMPQMPLVRQAPFFVGRVREQEILLEAFERSRHTPQLVLVSAENGLGKSALLREFSLLRQEQEVSVWHERCHEHEDVPYKAFDGIVDMLAIALSKQDQSKVSMPEGSASLARIFPVLRGIPLFQAAPHETALRDLQAEKHRAFSAFFSLLTQLSGFHPAVIVLDDLHWADALSLEMIEWLLRDEHAPPCFLLASTMPLRAEERHPLQALSTNNVLHLALGPIEESTIVKLIEQHAAETLSGEEKRQIVRETEGNPFLAISLAQIWRRGEKTALPTLSGLVESRLSQIGFVAKRLLELVTLVDGSCSLSLFRSCSPLRIGEIREGLDELLQADFLQEGYGQEESFLLGYERFRSILESQIDPTHKQDFHRSIATYYLSQSDAVRAVEHWQRAGEEGQARNAAVEAAQQAESQLDFSRAAELYRLAAGTPPEVELQRKQAAMLRKAGRHIEAAACYVESSQGDDSLEGRYARLEASIEYIVGGDLKNGLEGVRSLLAALKLPYGANGFSGMLRLVFLLVWLVILLTLRKLRCRFGMQENIRAATPETEFRLNLYDKLSRTLLLYDPVLSVEFGIRHALLAVRYSRHLHIGRAYISHGLRLVGILGKRVAAKAFYHIEQGEALCSHKNDLQGLLFGQYTRELVCFTIGNLQGVARAMQEAERIGKRGGLGGDPSFAGCKNVYLASLVFSGDIENFKQLSTQYVEDAKRRGSDIERGELLTTMALGFFTIGSTEGVFRCIEESLPVIPESPLTLQRLRLETNATLCQLLKGETNEGLLLLSELKKKRHTHKMVLAALDKMLWSMKRSLFEVQRLHKFGIQQSLSCKFDLFWLSWFASPMLLAIFLRLRAAFAFHQKKKRRALALIDSAVWHAEQNNYLSSLCLALYSRSKLREHYELEGAALDRERALYLAQKLEMNPEVIMAVEGF